MSKKKRIVILSYIFPPHAHVGGRRAYFFAKYLSKYGYEVTVVTSNKPVNVNFNWDTDISFCKIIKLENVKIPDEYSISEKILAKIYWKLYEKKNRLLKSIAWKIGELFLPLDFNNRLDYDEDKLAKQIGNVDYILATGGPWHIFEYGVRLKKVLNCDLILDYRDPLSDLTGVGLKELTDKGFLSFWINLRLKKIEINYLKQAIKVITVSHPLKKNIISIYPQYKFSIDVIYNGYDNDEFEFNSKKEDYIEWDYSKFTMSYIGVVKHDQNIEVLKKALEIIKKKNMDIYNNLKIYFIGSKIVQDRFSDLKTLKLSHPSQIEITRLIPKKETVIFYKNSQLFLHFSIANVKGILSSKIFQYLNLKKPILLVSNNEDVMEDLIRKTNTGYICKTPEQIAEVIIENYNLWKSGKPLPYNPNIDEVNKYSFENQTKRLIELIENDI